MQDLRSLNEGELMDILADNTLRFTQLFQEAREDIEYNICKETINAIIDEIRKRKKSAATSRYKW